VTYLQDNMTKDDRYKATLAWLRDDTTLFHKHLGLDAEWIEEHVIRPLHAGESVAFGRLMGSAVGAQGGGGSKGLCLSMFVEAARIVAKHLGNTKAPQVPRSAIERMVRMCRNTEQAANSLSITVGVFNRLVNQYGIHVPWSGALGDMGQHKLTEKGSRRRGGALR
jgi:hypothetical protein